uniref:Serine protease n=1 Tax=Knipowitschia caucasica TaxID=637954 RepID=A0AAV2JB83_KNICA
MNIENILRDILDVTTYNTFMYYGSSGSPVFDNQCKVFGMHSAGFTYSLPSETSSVIEFSRPVGLIFERKSEVWVEEEVEVRVCRGGGGQCEEEVKVWEEEVRVCGGGGQSCVGRRGQMVRREGVVKVEEERVEEEGSSECERRSRVGEEAGGPSVKDGGVGHSLRRRRSECGQEEEQSGGGGESECEEERVRVCEEEAYKFEVGGGTDVRRPDELWRKSSQQSLRCGGQPVGRRRRIRV